MSLLGQGFDDPRSAAVMALAGGLLQRNIGGGLLAANNAYGEAKQNAAKQRYMDMQMQAMQSEIDQRKQAALKQAEGMAMLKNLLGGGAPSYEQGQLGSGTMGIVPNANPMAPARPTGGLANATPEQIAMAKMYGLDLTEPWKVAKQGFALKPGEFRMDPATNQREYIGDPTKGITMQGGQVGIMPGYLEAQRAITMATEGPKAEIAAQNDLVKVVGPDGAERYLPRSTVLGRSAPSAPQPQPAPVSSPRMGAESDRFAILSQELARAQATGNASDVAALQREIARLPAAARTATNPSGLAVPGFQATPTTEQAASAAAARTTAEQTAKDVAEQRKQIMAADVSAPTNIARYRQIGKLLTDVDGGKFTPLGTEFASALNGFGIKIDKNLPNKEAAAAIANEAALQLRNPAGGAGMPGALSDADRNFLASMTPNMAQSSQGRKQVIDAYVAVQSRNQQVAQFARNYEKKYGRLDNGFFDQLSAWSNSNPLFKGQ